MSGGRAQRGRRDGKAAVVVEEHIAELLGRGGQHAHVFIAAVGGGVHVGEDLVHGEGFVPSGVHNPRRHQQQRQQDAESRQRLLPAKPYLQHFHLPQSEAQDHHDQRHQQQKDSHQVLADAVQDLGVEVDDDVLTHTDLTDGHKVAEDAVIDQLHLSKQHLRGD